MISEQIRHHVSIAGQFSSSFPITIKVTAAPETYRFDVEDPRRLATQRADGAFWFLDLPEGNYEITASPVLPGGRGGSQTLKLLVASDAITPAVFAIPVTSLGGKITLDGKAVFLAQVRFAGSEDRAFSEVDGQYQLTAAEAGMRTVQVSAGGAQPFSKTVKLEVGQSTTLDIQIAAI